MESHERLAEQLLSLTDSWVRIAGKATSNGTLLACFRSLLLVIGRFELLISFTILEVLLLLA